MIILENSLVNLSQTTSVQSLRRKLVVKIIEKQLTCHQFPVERLIRGPLHLNDGEILGLAFIDNILAVLWDQGLEMETLKND